MKLRTFLIAGVSALFGLCLALVVINSVSAQAAVAPAAVERGVVIVGRYKVEMVPAIGTIMYDTTTGDCWRLHDDPWEWLGNPRNPAAKK
jgi:hypothetical protein